MAEKTVKDVASPLTLRSEVSHEKAGKFAYSKNLTNPTPYITPTAVRLPMVRT